MQKTDLLDNIPPHIIIPIHRTSQHQQCHSPQLTARRSPDRVSHDYTIQSAKFTQLDLSWATIRSMLVVVSNTSYIVVCNAQHTVYVMKVGCLRFIFVSFSHLNFSWSAICLCTYYHCMFIVLFSRILAASTYINYGTTGEGYQDW